MAQKIVSRTTQVDERGEWAVVRYDNGVASRHLAKPDPNYVPDAPVVSVAERRREAYPPINDLVVALWEYVVENRPEAAVDLQAARQAVKDQYPKEQEVQDES